MSVKHWFCRELFLLVLVLVCGVGVKVARKLACVKKRFYFFVFEKKKNFSILNINNKFIKSDCFCIQIV